MDRRTLLTSAAMLTAATTLGHAATPAAHSHHHHGQSAQAELLLDVVSDCIIKGELCLAHCLILLGDGDKSVAGCARSVNETLALCEGLRKLVAQDSKRAKAVALIAMNACLDCEKECLKHAKLHKECRDCAAACAACARECKAYAS